jgi:hypothetical protein
MRRTIRWRSIADGVSRTASEMRRPAVVLDQYDVRAVGEQPLAALRAITPAQRRIAANTG